MLAPSRSSLSACAAYLKRADGLVLYHPFWHEMLPVEDGHVACNDAKLDAMLAAFVRRWRDAARGS